MVDEDEGVCSWGFKGGIEVSSGGVDALEEHVVWRGKRSCDELGDVASATGGLCEAGVSVEDIGSDEAKEFEDEELGAGRLSATKGIGRS